MGRHPNKDLSSLVRLHLCICLSNFDDPTFLEGEAGVQYKDYSWEKYRMMCRLGKSHCH